MGCCPDCPIVLGAATRKDLMILRWRAVPHNALLHQPARKVPPAFRQTGPSMPGFAGTIRTHGVADAESRDGLRALQATLKEELR